MLLEKEHPFLSITIIDEHFEAGQKHLCFMRNEKIPEDFIQRTWNRISMTDSDGNRSSHELKFERYKLLDWKKLHKDTLALCENNSRVKLIRGRVNGLAEAADHVSVSLVNGEKIIGDKVFNSVQYKPSSCDLIQQFKGAIIEFEEEQYNPSEASLMDFKGQYSNTDVEFKYELPFSKSKALVEYTIITSNPLTKDELNKRFNQLLSKMKNVKTVSFEESGAIPMPMESLSSKNTFRTMHIGIAGGFQRRSSGYLLQTVHDQLELWSNFASSLTSPPITKRARFKEYLDTVFLSVLKSKPSSGKTLFLAMFKGTSGDQFLRFMFNRITLSSVLPIVLSLPKTPFLKHAAIHFRSLF